MENIDNLKSWASQPDVCRCCLSTNGSWDLLAAYISDEGEKEIYSEIIHSCFGISLSSLSEWGSSRLVCEVCVSRLREAHSFRRQVLRAEDHFLIYTNSIHEAVRVDHISSPPGLIEDSKPIDTDKNTESLNDADDWQCADTVDVKQKHEKSYTKLEVANTENEPLQVINEFETQVEENIVMPSPAPLQRLVKQVSERKRIKATCNTVLRHTTACPFRHHNSWFRCFFCTQSFMDIPSLKQHTELTHTTLEVKQLKRHPRSLQIDITELSCRLCDLKLIDVDTMRIHFKEIHGQVIYKECIADYKVTTSPYSCHLCGKQFHVFRTLTTHLNEHYANYICAVCGKSFLNSKRLKVHNRTHESGAFPCSECGKVLKTKSSQVNHIESHTKRVVRCQICSKPMKHYNDRIKHMSEAHNITHTFKCPICSREYNIKHYLATHIRQTHGNKDNKCGECGMAFVTNHSLKKHMQRHSGVKAFLCSVCNKSYARSYSLKEHMRVHDR